MQFSKDLNALSVGGFKITNERIFYFILITAGVLRFWNFSELDFTHDELSALARTGVGDFSELITKGVLPDSHPPLIQVFLYTWSGLVGYDEFLIKLPFLLMGIGAIYFLYRIAQQWYNDSVGLIGASFFAVMQFTVMFSQIARPYVSGVFLVLWAGYHWSKLFHHNGNSKKHAVLFVLAAVLACYNHHFSLFLIAIMGLGGLVLVKKQQVKPYLLCGLAIVILYTPNLPIFFAQLSQKGIGEWLGKPEDDFLIRFFKYLFHYSILFGLVPVLVFIIGLFGKSNSTFDWRSLLLFNVFFFMPFIVGYYYSIYVNPVLRESGLIFGLPFLFLGVFGCFKVKPVLVNSLIVLTVLITGITTLVIQRQHYTIFYQLPFQQVMDDQNKAREFDPNVVSVLNADQHLTRFFYKVNEQDTSSTWFETYENEEEFIQQLKESVLTRKHLFLGVPAVDNPVTVALVKSFYPTLIWRNDYYGTSTYLFSTEPAPLGDFVERNSFDSTWSKGWSNIFDWNCVPRKPFSGKKCYNLWNTEWSPVFEIPIYELTDDENDYIDVFVKVRLLDIPDDVKLVIAIMDGDEALYWSERQFNLFLDAEDKDRWGNVMNSVRVVDTQIPIDQKYTFKTFIWNKGVRDFLIDDFTVSIRKGNPRLYSLYRDF